MSPTVGDDLPIFGQEWDRLLQIGFGNTPRTWNVTLRKSVSATGIEKHKVERHSAFYCVQHIVALFFCMKFVSEIVAVRTNFIR
ncbi:MAG TPA: hypothetical protein VFW94_22565 [Candidatus Acidoferrales bacterium]|nr:hypothetical protein [Candidatus Acidoferrales bacterium]